MFRFDFVLTILNDFNIMLLTAFILWGGFEIVKIIFGDKIKEPLRKAYPYIIMVIGFVIYSIIASKKGWMSPILTGIVNGIALGLLEGGMFSILSGLEKLVEYLWGLLKKKIGNKKNEEV